MKEISFQCSCKDRANVTAVVISQKPLCAIYSAIVQRISTVRVQTESSTIFSQSRCREHSASLRASSSSAIDNIHGGSCTSGSTNVVT